VTAIDDIDMVPNIKQFKQIDSICTRLVINSASSSSWKKHGKFCVQTTRNAKENQKRTREKNWQFKIQMNQRVSVSCFKQQEKFHIR
jgi:hypothetical protein